MENREPPRMSMGEGPATRRFARFVASPKVHRLAPTRLVLAILAASAGFLLLGLLISSFANSAQRWLNHQPQHQLAFREIELVPPPPPWYQGDTPVFLDRVREAAALKADSFPVLEVPPQELKRVFGLYCWVERVLRVEKRYPNRVIISLEYRKPVAIPESASGLLLDGNGVFLPVKDVERAALPTPIPIRASGKPYNPRPGEKWKQGDPEKGPVETKELAVKAARLAAFLQTARTAIKPDRSAPSVLLIHAKEEGGLWVLWEKTWVHWHHAPGDEETGEPGADAKWTALGEWFGQHGAREVAFPEYLAFTRAGIEVRKGN